MPSQHKTPLLGWHPTSAEDADWARAEGKRRGSLRALLDEMLSEYRTRHGGKHQRAAVTESGNPAPRKHALTCKCGTCKPRANGSQQ